jgi:hypothetical protein
MPTMNVLDASGATVSVNVPNPDGQAVSASSRSVVLASDHPTVAVNQAGVSASGTITALNANPTSGTPTAGSTVTLSLTGATGFAIDVRGTFSATLTFQGTINGTDWFTLNAVPAGNAANVALVSTSTAVGAWVGNGNGLQQVRVTATAYASGTATVTLRAMQAAGVTNAVSTGTSGGWFVTAFGTNIHGGNTDGKPIRLAGRGLTSNYTPLTNNLTADLVTTVVGALIQKPFSIPEHDWQFAQQLTTSTPVSARAAQASGIRNYVTGAQFSNSGGSAIDVIVLDGVTGVWRATVPASGYVDAVFQSPLRTTAATALNVNLSGVGTVNANLQGFSAP